MRLLIAGSRDLDENKLRTLFDINSLLELFNLDWPKEFIHGGCPTGADAYCAMISDEYWDSTPVKIFKADWDKYGKMAGPIRNKKMAVYADVLILIWDGESKGSKNMKEEMLILNKPVYEIILRSYNDPK